MSRRYYEDEIPTRPNRGTRTDSDTLLGRIMAEVMELRKRVEILEDVAQGRTPQIESEPPTSRSYLPIIKKTITYAVVTIAGILSALRELGILK